MIQNTQNINIQCGNQGKNGERKVIRYIFAHKNISIEY